MYINLSQVTGTWRKKISHLSLSLLSCLSLTYLPAVSSADTPETSTQLIIEDNDFLGPGGSDILSTIPLLAHPGIKVLGFTVAIGDGWENAESAHIRRFLEIAHRSAIPVADGATLPLRNRVALMREWEQHYGFIPWKGAWGGTGTMSHIPDTQPPLPINLPEGNPHTPPIALSAVDFLIRQVHAHPGQVTIIENGPMTNLALAIHKDPTFAHDAKQLIFMGGLLDRNLMQVTGNADNASDFNFLFDPEAAHITLHAPWRKITSLGNVADSVIFTSAFADRINAAHTPVTEYLRRFVDPLPMWDEISSSVAINPHLITRSLTAYMDVDTCPGMDYGRAHVWNERLAPHNQGLQKVTIVQSIDVTSFINDFIHAAQTLQ